MLTRRSTWYRLAGSVAKSIDSNDPDLLESFVDKAKQFKSLTVADGCPVAANPQSHFDRDALLDPYFGLLAPLLTLTIRALRETCTSGPRRLIESDGTLVAALAAEIAPLDASRRWHHVWSRVCTELSVLTPQLLDKLSVLLPSGTDYLSEVMDHFLLVNGLRGMRLPPGDRRDLAQTLYEAIVSGGANYMKFMQLVAVVAGRDLPAPTIQTLRALAGFDLVMRDLARTSLLRSQACINLLSGCSQSCFARDSLILARSPHLSLYSERYVDDRDAFHAGHVNHCWFDPERFDIFHTLDGLMVWPRRSIQSEPAPLIGASQDMTIEEVRGLPSRHCPASFRGGLQTMRDLLISLAANPEIWGSMLSDIDETVVSHPVRSDPPPPLPHADHPLSIAEFWS